MTFQVQHEAPTSTFSVPQVKQIGMRFRWEHALRVCNEFSAAERGVLMTFATYADGTTGKNLFKSVKQLSIDTGMSRKAIQSALDHAVKRGWLRKLPGRQGAVKQYELRIPLEQELIAAEHYREEVRQKRSEAAKQFEDPRLAALLPLQDLNELIRSGIWS